jgi:hypothetical protein
VQGEVVEEELKPCPFCGENPRVHLEWGVPMIMCSTLGCVSLMDIDSPFLDEVAERWNTRAEIREIK